MRDKKYNNEYSFKGHDVLFQCSADFSSCSGSTI